MGVSHECGTQVERAGVRGVVGHNVGDLVAEDGRNAVFIST